MRPHDEVTIMYDDTLFASESVKLCCRMGKPSRKPGADLLAAAYAASKEFSNNFLKIKSNGVEFPFILHHS
jgi:hypothetical protein